MTEQSPERRVLSVKWIVALYWLGGALAWFLIRRIIATFELPVTLFNIATALAFGTMVLTPLAILAGLALYRRNPQTLQATIIEYSLVITGCLAASVVFYWRLLSQGLSQHFTWGALAIDAGIVIFMAIYCVSVLDLTRSSKRQSKNLPAK